MVNGLEPAVGFGGGYNLLVACNQSFDYVKLNQDGGEPNSIFMIN